MPIPYLLFYRKLHAHQKPEVHHLLRVVATRCYRSEAQEIFRKGQQDQPIPEPWTHRATPALRALYRWYPACDAQYTSKAKQDGSLGRHWRGSRSILHNGPMCGRVIQSSGPLRYAIVDGLNVRDSRAHNYPPRLERRAQPRATGHPAQPQDRRSLA
jgi:hypothetical protein